MRAEGVARPITDLGGVASYLELTKPRVTTLVVLTAATGFYLATAGRLDWVLLFHTLLGTALVAGGTAVLNQFMERENDGRMRRTAQRPLPSNRLRPLSAMNFGMTLVVGGVLYLTLCTNALTAFLGCLTSVVYLLAYTPLKTRTTLCTTVGAFAGAMPPLMGWAAVQGELTIEAWLIFVILFLWQYPHFWAVAWVYREDYERGGFRMLPLLDREGRSTGRLVVLFTLLLLVASVIPAALGMLGQAYLAGAVLFGVAFLRSALVLARSPSINSARHLLRASVIYLPLLLILMAVDKV